MQMGSPPSATQSLTKLYLGFSQDEFGASNWPLSQQKKKANFPNFQLKNIKKWMRIPILRLQKRAIKTVTREAFLSKGKHVPSSIISALLCMLLCNFHFACLVLMLLKGACCACAVFGVCTNDDFPRNESTWVLFSDMLPILSSA